MWPPSQQNRYLLNLIWWCGAVYFMIFFSCWIMAGLKGLYWFLSCRFIRCEPARALHQMGSPSDPYLAPPQLERVNLVKAAGMAPAGCIPRYNQTKLETALDFNIVSTVRNYPQRREHKGRRLLCWGLTIAILTCKAGEAVRRADIGHLVTPRSVLQP